MLIRVTSLLACMVMLAASILVADDVKKDTKQESKSEFKNQTVCPVMGGKIDSTVYTDIQGQRVYHCCPGCSPKLKADPDKYFKQAAADGILFENIQTVCPVSGEELEEKTVFSDFEGRRIFFCCNKCKSSFAKDQVKYLKKLNELAPPKTVDGIEKKEKGHEGHNHG